MSLRDVELRDALRELFWGRNTGYAVSPGLHGEVTLEYHDIPFETALKGILDQVSATYRVEGGVYVMMPRDGSGYNRVVDTDYVQMLDFKPGTYSASFELSDTALFLSADRQWGGTSDLLVKAARNAGFHEWFAFSYGDGFALVLPAEAIRADGRPLKRTDRFAFRPSLASQDFRGIVGVFHNAPANRAGVYRVLVLVAGPGRIEPDGIESNGYKQRSPSNSGLPDYDRSYKWDAVPKLTVLVYEFRASRDAGGFALRKPGEPGLSGRDHAIASGLWKARDLR